QGRIAVAEHPSLRQYRVTLNIRGPLWAESRPGYVIADSHVLLIVLPDDFPAVGPTLRLSTPVLVPNCWPDGRPCLLSDEDPWHPGRSLVEVVHSTVELVQGVRQNERSVANSAANDLWREHGT